VRVVPVLQVQPPVRRRARARGRAVRASCGQAPRVLHQRVHDPVAVGERLDRPVREVAHPARVRPRLRRLAQGVALNPGPGSHSTCTELLRQLQR